ncbi:MULTISPECIES: cytochrome b/b6 domain-containing protein [unclassified Hyphomonas]|jgi:cytochrome b561|uniref:cytochrome b/b6 domain-containing protein n=2 Tax=Hyphomonas TaxID=85 RepID=UPI000C98259A|nr:MULTISPECIES: cytochrome b/b6 domain-containing protein [unclassified Hyphomonas]MAL46475.1 hypothetical protein [Hyphomonas sp.]MBL4877642.1 cytochrome b/b6 domain-containing protein [Hyphomonas sp.]HAW57325.1 cytochrome b/b6 domain-containing protein [Hyphomonas sp.]HBJ42438.1 cytochrome b/b6 domain-containing protein [Hyphomonas sp.]HBN93091.1 cytochrome b/b6 domain-containing protein [Hyphomonas sp.]|tara:strand:- start:901 stop:1509 length:609 start_codon:yes stop_codon:yes gene_type:complete
MAASHNPEYSLKTRLVHMLIAIAVIVQLATSLVMKAHPQDGTEDVFFEVHEYSGLISFAVICAFWVIILFRQRGTTLAELFPWFSTRHRKELIEAVKARFRNTDKTGRLSFYDGDPFAKAVHGLGIAIISVMAMTGVTYFVALKLGADEGILASGAMLIHEPVSKLAWAYLVAHAGIAVFHALLKERPLSVMWNISPWAQKK